MPHGDGIGGPGPEPLNDDHWAEIVDLVTVAQDSDHELRWCDGTQCVGCKRWGPLLEAVRDARALARIHVQRGKVVEDSNVTVSIDREEFYAVAEAIDGYRGMWAPAGAFEFPSGYRFGVVLMADEASFACLGPDGRVGADFSGIGSARIQAQVWHAEMERANCPGCVDRRTGYECPTHRPWPEKEWWNNGPTTQESEK